MSFALLVESALRALLLGASVWVLMRLVRLRDARTETILWTLVLLAALAMPLLIKFAQGLWPVWTAFHLPQIDVFAAAPPSPRVAVAWTAQVARQGVWTGQIWDWLTQHATTLLWSGYSFVSAGILARLATGLFLTARLYRDAVPVTTPLVTSLAPGRAVRASARLRGPIAFASCILLPADYVSWPQTKLAAILAHEQCHIQRGDFFIQLLASFYRVIFWFSPFAWWLQAQLSSLAETASDEAAVRRLNDRVSYAEILIEVSAQAQGLPAYGSAMSKGPDIALRIDRILDERAVQNLSWGARATLMAATLPVALAIAGAHAAIPTFIEAPARSLQMVAAGPVVHNPAPSSIPATTTLRAPRLTHRRRAATAAPLPVATFPAISPPVPPQKNFTYNPRALLDSPAVLVVPAALLLTR
jgi:beta-lactamase regulating signal transducer with metallopeptidase domain